MAVAGDDKKESSSIPAKREKSYIVPHDVKNIANMDYWMSAGLMPPERQDRISVDYDSFNSNIANILRPQYERERRAKDEKNNHALQVAGKSASAPKPCGTALPEDEAVEKVVERIEYENRETMGLYAGAFRGEYPNAAFARYVSDYEAAEEYVGRCLDKKRENQQ
jgi:hypothetical protein